MIKKCLLLHSFVIFWKYYRSGVQLLTLVIGGPRSNIILSVQIQYTTVRAKSRLRDTITQTWYYHVCVILCITQTWYLISGKFLTLKKMSVRCALFRTLLIHTFPQECLILKIVFSLKNQSITSVWYIVSHRRDSIMSAW